MASEDILMVKAEELKRYHVIQKVIEKKLKQWKAGELLGISERQVRRVVVRVREEGEAGVVHRSRGKPSNRRIDERTKRKVLSLYRERYSDFGPTLANEKLWERDKIRMSDETLRLWLIQEGTGYRRRRGRPHRSWRERKPSFGEMVQMDGSHHEWLEHRGPKLVLMGYIDDATGTVFGRFYEYEGTFPAMDSFRGYIKRYGIPLSVYLDKHTTYQSNAKLTIEEELEDKKPLSQFERAMSELGVRVIHAHSAPAKGRIERLFKTLQDRLVKEMRLRGIKTLQEANEFLERYLEVYNQRFRIPPVQETDLHRRVPRGMHLEKILCKRTSRALRNDLTVAHEKKLYQVLDAVRTQKVSVEERLDGSICLLHQGTCLRYREISRRTKPQPQNPALGPRQRKYIPPANPLWRRFQFKNPSLDKNNLETIVEKESEPMLVGTLK